MTNEQFILEAVRQIQNCVAINDGLLVAIRSEIQHLGRRIDNLVGTSLLRLTGSRNEASDIVAALTAMSDRLAAYEGKVSAPARAAPATKAAAKKAAQSRPAKAAGNKRAASRNAPAKGAAPGKRGR